MTIMKNHSQKEKLGEGQLVIIKKLYITLLILTTKGKGENVIEMYSFERQMPFRMFAGWKFCFTVEVAKDDATAPTLTVRTKTGNLGLNTTSQIRVLN